jgi:hypothetical protein
MRRSVQAIAFALSIAALGALGGCASAGARAAAANDCVLSQDQVTLARGLPLYRDCNVDRKARLAITRLHPQFTPNSRGGPTCYSAMVEFVIDSTGRAEKESIHVVKTTDPSFGAAVADVVPRLSFEPAMKGGQTVRQIDTYEEKMSISKVVVPAGAPARNPTPRAPAC